MKKLFYLLSKIDIKVSTLLIILFALLSGRERPLFIHLFLALIHELGHVFFAVLLHVKVSKITILPFGLYAQMDDLEHVHIVKELIIVIGGPITYFLNTYLLTTMYGAQMISFQLLEQGRAANDIILLFNILPIYPLDGSRLLSIVLSYFFPYKIVKKLSWLFSLGSFIFLLVFGYNSANLIVYSYLLYMQIFYIMRFKEFYLSFIVSRLRKNVYKKAIVNQKNDFYRPYDNIFLKNGRFVSEEKFAMYLLKNQRKSNI